MTIQAQAIKECKERTEGIIATRKRIEELDGVEPISNLKPHAGDNPAIAGFLDEAYRAQSRTVAQLQAAAVRFESSQDANYREAVRLADFPAEGEDGLAQLAELRAWLAERGFTLGV